MWPFVNGVALANRDKAVFCLGSDGSQQEGNDAEAARLAVAQGLNVKLLIGTLPSFRAGCVRRPNQISDDNDVTIAGHPSEYLKGYELTKTLKGHGLEVLEVQGEDIDALWGAVSAIVAVKGPAASNCYTSHDKAKSDM
jgi:transketolase N-terminal domain/subunit